MALSPSDLVHTYEAVRGSIYAYVLNTLLAYPPHSAELVAHYQQTFAGLFMEWHLSALEPAGVRGFMHVLHLFSVHDYLLYVLKLRFDA